MSKSRDIMTHPINSTNSAVRESVNRSPSPEDQTRIERIQQVRAECVDNTSSFRERINETIPTSVEREASLRDQDERIQQVLAQWISTEEGRKDNDTLNRSREYLLSGKYEKALRLDCTTPIGSSIQERQLQDYQHAEPSIKTIKKKLRHPDRLSKEFLSRLDQELRELPQASRMFAEHWLQDAMRLAQIKEHLAQGQIEKALEEGEHLTTAPAKDYIQSKTHRQDLISACKASHEPTANPTSETPLLKGAASTEI